MKKFLLSLVLLLTVSLTATASTGNPEVKPVLTFQTQIGESLVPILNNIFKENTAVVVGACKTTVKKRTLSFGMPSDYWLSSECWQDSNGGWFKTQSWSAHWEDERYVPAGSNTQSSNSSCSCG